MDKISKSELSFPQSYLLLSTEKTIEGLFQSTWSHEWLVIWLKSQVKISPLDDFLKWYLECW